MHAHAIQAGLYWPLLLYIAAVVVAVLALVAVSSAIGERRERAAPDEPFESGVVSVGYARFHVPAKFYLVAVFFVVFDLESAFLYAWSVAARSAGWAGYASAMVFIAVLGAALAYLWRAGALDWAPRREREK